MSGGLYEVVLTRLKEISFAGRLSFNFYNEPLLHPQLETYIGRAKEVLPEVKVHLYSNGTLLTKEKFDQLDSAGVDQYIITRHEMEMDRDFAFETTYAELAPAQKKRVVYKNYDEIKLFNRGGFLPHLGDKGLALHPCFLPSHMMIVTVDGHVLPCFEDFKEDKVFGNLRTHSIKEIWDQDSYAQFRKDLARGLRHLHGPCRDCNRSDVLPPFN
jgi:radical SAM protein with 4Fe4S-binding SPASM domain